MAAFDIMNIDMTM